MTVDDYVNRLAAIVEDVVPTARVAARAEHLPASGSLRQFLARNPAYEIRATPVAAFLSATPAALDFLPDDDAKAAFTRTLKSVERTFRIAPPGARLETMEVLLEDGLDSAQKIRAIGRGAFLRRYQKRLGGDRARRVFARASHAAAAATILVARHGAGFDSTSMPVLPPHIEALTRFPDYRSLFGAIDACSCTHCQSVYSPAAYLTDVLHWLGGRDATDGGNALDVLLGAARRPDLGTIELSCPNTHTSLPQIDLINEILELAVSAPEEPPTYQTRGAAEDLRVQPEHLHAPAYRVLAGASTDQDAVYPFGLPYNLWLDEARTYLGQLGAPRHALMEALHAGGRDAAVAAPSVGAEMLGMSPLEWDLIAGKPLDPPREPAAFWGLTGDPDWVATLSNVATLLERATPAGDSAMGYEELEDLLRTDFVQASEQALGVWFEGAACDTTRATLVDLGAAHLDRIHRFVRLRRQLGWSAADLDRAIGVLGGGVLDEPALLEIAIVRRLQATLDGIELAELLTWWGAVDTRRWRRRLRSGRPAGIPAEAEGIGLVFTTALAPLAANGHEQSPYDTRFLSRSVDTALDDALRVGPDGVTLLDETQPLADHGPAIAAALGVTADDLGTLSAELPDGTLSLSNLSRLYRQVSLARALRISVADLRTLLTLTEIDPFDPDAPADALAFVEQVRAVRTSGFSVDELAYLLRHVEARPAPRAPSETAIGVLLLELRDALRKARADQPDEPTRRQASRSAVVDQLAGSLGLEPAIAAPILEQYVRSPDVSGDLGIDVFLDPALVAYDVTDPETGAPVPPTPADLPAAFATYQRLHKVALLIARLGVTTAELAWVFDLGPQRGTLDVNDLPVAAAAPPAAMRHGAGCAMRSPCAIAWPADSCWTCSSAPRSRRRAATSQRSPSPTSSCSQISSGAPGGRDPTSRFSLA